MNTIDHRILIPAAQPTVWKYVSDLSNNARWQVNCRASTPLTTMRDGPGARWRLSSDRGRDTVIEITAWYDGLGYEYRFIDGSPYRESRGRLRLQEVAEGTVVQWTFNYELGGMLSGLRNSMGVRRAVETDMTDSLWTLWRHITQAEPNELDAIKSLMRDAPDVEARANYQPRHPSIVEQRPPELRDLPAYDITVESVEASEQPAAPQPAAIIDEPSLDIQEPPVTEDDTRPRGAVAESAPATPIKQESSINEPDFLVTMSDDMMDELAESQRLKPVDESKVAGVAERIDAQPAVPPVTEPPIVDELATSPKPTAAPEPDAASEDAPEASPEPLATSETLGRSAPAGKEFELPRLEDDEEIEGDIDTSKVSVFELFGLTKPSQTQEVEIVHAEAPAHELPEAAALIVGKAVPAAMSSTPLTLRRTGKRLLLRRTLVNLRLYK